MESVARRKARAFVVAGFALVAAGSIITFLRITTSGSYFSNASALSDFEWVLSPLIGLVAVWSWWWLSRIQVADREQSSFVRRGFFGLALQNALYTALTLAVLLDIRVFNRDWWNVAPLWAQFGGSLAMSIGFILLGREFANNADETSEPSGV